MSWLFGNPASSDQQTGTRFECPRCKFRMIGRTSICMTCGFVFERARGITSALDGDTISQSDRATWFPIKGNPDPASHRSLRSAKSTE